MKIRVIYTAFLTTCAFHLIAQQEPIYTQYMFNPLNYNAAYCGSKAILSSALVYRNQWVGIEGSPKVFTFSAHSPLKNKNMGVGLEASNDKIGPTSNLWIKASYAYRIRLSKISKGKLGFGLKAGIYRSSYNWNSIRYKDLDDGLIGADKQNFTIPVFDFGLYYHKTNRSFAGLSFTNLNSPKVKLDYDPQISGLSSDERDLKTTTRLYTQIILTYGRIIELNERVVFRPSGLLRSTFQSSPVVDINLSLLFDQVFWAGISYRSTNSIAAVLEYEISEQFKIGYSFDYELNPLTSYTSGSHEIFLGFSYNVFKSRMRSPRYYF